MSQSQEISSQRASEKRKKEYRKLLDQAEILHEEEGEGIETTKAIDQILRKANALFKENKIDENCAEHTDEVLLDAKLLATTSTVLFNITDAIDAAVDSYDLCDFAKRIRRTYLNQDANFEYDDLEWSNLFETTRKIIKPSPEYIYMCGYSSTNTVSPGKPPKEKKKRQAKDKNEAIKKQPEKIAKVNQEEDSVDDTVKFLQWALNKEYDINGGKPLNYFTFIFDPKNFTHTIENMFHLSFLIRDGRVKLHKDDNDMLVVSPVSSSESKKATKEGLPFKQCVMSIDTEIWQKAIKKLKIKSRFLDKWKPKWDERKNRHA